MRTRLHTSERGAAALMVAASLVLMLGIAAFAVDLGAVFNEDRQDQTAADLAAVAGAIAFVGTDPAGGARDAVLTFVRDNLTTTYSNADWQAMWESCTDPDRPTGFNPVPRPAGWSAGTIACISGSTDELRVRVPDQIVDTNFAGVVGVGSLPARAVAQAAVEFRSGGGVRPFGILDGLPVGSTCLTTSPSGLAAPPCDGPDSGNFGTLNSQTWGAEMENNGSTIATVMDCGVPGNEELGQNIAVGVDHLIGIAPSFAGSGGPYGAFPAATTRLDDCTVSGGLAVASDTSPPVGPVNTMRADTGFNLFQATKIGMISGLAADFPNASPAPTPLLRQTALSGSLSQLDLSERIGGTTYTYRVDNTPMWRHLLPWAQLTARGVPGSCNSANIQGAANKTVATDLCLTEFEAAVAAGTATGPLFADTIAQNPRFGWVPQFHFTTWGSGNHWQPVKTYRMIYLDTIWFNCNGKYDPSKNDEACDGAKGLVFEPGPHNPAQLQVGNGNNMRELRLDQISAYLLPLAAVSDEVASQFPGTLRGPFDIVLTR